MEKGSFSILFMIFFLFTLKFKIQKKEQIIYLWFFQININCFWTISKPFRFRFKYCLLQSYWKQLQFGSKNCSRYNPSYRHSIYIRTVSFQCICCWTGWNQFIGHLGGATCIHCSLYTLVLLRPVRKEWKDTNVPMLNIVLPHLYFFWNLEIVENSNTCRNISIFELINRIFLRKLFKGGNYLRKYGT